MFKSILTGLWKATKKFLFASIIIGIATGILTLFGELGLVILLIGVGAMVCFIEVRDEIDLAKFKKEKIKASLINDIDDLYFALCDEFKVYANEPELIRESVKRDIDRYNELVKTLSSIKGMKMWCEGYNERLRNLIIYYNYK